MLASNFLSCTKSCEIDFARLQRPRPTIEPKIFSANWSLVNPKNQPGVQQDGAALKANDACRLTSSTASFERNEEACELMERLLAQTSAVYSCRSDESGRASQPQLCCDMAPRLLSTAKRNIGCRLSRLGGALLNRLRPQRRPHRRQEWREDQKQRQRIVDDGGGDRGGDGDGGGDRDRDSKGGSPKSVRSSGSEGPAAKEVKTAPQLPPAFQTSMLPRPCRDFAAAASALVAAAADMPDVNSRSAFSGGEIAWSRRNKRRIGKQKKPGCWDAGTAYTRARNESRSYVCSSSDVEEDINASICGDYSSRKHEVSSEFDTAQAATVYDSTTNFAEAATAAAVSDPSVVAASLAAASLKCNATVSIDNFESRGRLSYLGLSMAIGFLPVGRRHGWSVMATALPINPTPAWSDPQFDWSISGDQNCDYLIKALYADVPSSTSPAMATQCSPVAAGAEGSAEPAASNSRQQHAQQRMRRRITLVKYSLNGQPIQLAATRQPPSTAAAAGSESAARLLTPQAEVQVPWVGRLIGLYCTAKYVTVAIRQRDNLAIRVYSSDLWPITAERLMRNQSLTKEAVDAADIGNEKIQCLTVDKIDQSIVYYHTYRLLSTGKTMRRLCSLSLPDLQVSKRLPLKDDAKSIKVGAKYLAVYFANNGLTVYCKTSRAPVFDFSARKLSSLFLGDTFEMDSQDRLVEVSEQRIRSLFYNGVTYRDCSCANLQELSKRPLIGRRVEFYEALQCHLTASRLTGKAKGACRVRLRSNGKLLRCLEAELMYRSESCNQVAMPIIVSEEALWLDGVPEPGFRPGQHHQQQHQHHHQQQQHHQQQHQQHHQQQQQQQQQQHYHLYHHAVHTQQNQH